MILNIVFSYNRALQLDCFLESFLKYFTGIDYSIAVIYHTSGEKHGVAYQKLISKFENYTQIKFYERSQLNLVNYYYQDRKSVV